MSLIFILACWFVGVTQWAMMLTEGHFEARENWPEVFIVGEAVARTFLALAMMLGSIAISDFVP